MAPSISEKTAPLINQNSELSYVDFDTALKSARCEIKEYNPNRAKSIRLERGGRLVTIDNFAIEIRDGLGERGIDYPLILRLTYMKEFYDFVDTYCKQKFKRAPLPDNAAGIDQLKLCIDPTKAEDPFYCITPMGRMSIVAGKTFLRKMKIPEAEAYDVATFAVQEYGPRDPRGIYSAEAISGERYDHFNTYIPPKWEDYTDSVPDKLPPLWVRLIDHLIPWKPEQEYFYAWLHDSLYARAEVFLVLNGNPGIGKGTLKNVLFALHGLTNSSEGTRSMLTEKFNAPLFGCTLLYFDEVAYDAGTENRLKQMQNSKVPKEAKGQDQTRGDRNHASIIIANNDVDDNYLHIESRKFAPLIMGVDRLETVLSQEEIQSLNAYAHDNDPRWDLRFLTQIARWVKKHGRPPHTYEKWKNLDYKGPKFHQLVQTSLRLYQRNLLFALLDPEKRRGKKIEQHAEHGFLWSSLQDAVAKKSKSEVQTGYQKSRTFIDSFKNDDGVKVFATVSAPKNMLADFWVKVVDRNFDPLTPEKLQKIIDPEGLSELAKDIF